MSANGNPVMRREFLVSSTVDEKEGRIIEGCCVPYGKAEKVADSPGGPAYYEVFEPGAFRKQLNAADKIELRYEHGATLADSIGIGRSLKEEAHGLFGTFEIYDDDGGDRALNMIRAGRLRGLSIEFSDRFSHWQRTGEGTVVRQNCLLHSVGLVRTPAHAGALVTTMRSRAELLGDIEIPDITDEQLERLRAVGISV